MTIIIAVTYAIAIAVMKLINEFPQILLENNQKDARRSVQFDIT